METPGKEKPAKARGPRPRRRRWPLLAVTITAALALGALGVHRLAGSRTYQLAGDLTDRVETREKVVALTFDDGPDEHINEIVGTLAGEHVRATFFVIGSQLSVLTVQGLLGILSPSLPLPFSRSCSLSQNK